MTPQARATALVAVALLPVTGGLVASWEGTEFTPYRDLGGVWTVCEGVTGPAVIPGKVYSRQECRDLLNAIAEPHLKPFAYLNVRGVGCFAGLAFATDCLLV